MTLVYTCVDAALIDSLLKTDIASWDNIYVFYDTGERIERTIDIIKNISNRIYFVEKPFHKTSITDVNEINNLYVAHNMLAGESRGILQIRGTNINFKTPPVIPESIVSARVYQNNAINQKMLDSSIMYIPQVCLKNNSYDRMLSAMHLVAEKTGHLRQTLQIDAVYYNYYSKFGINEIQG